MTDVAGNPEEERRAEFYHQPWSQEAVSRYFYCKVWRGPRTSGCPPPLLHEKPPFSALSAAFGNPHPLTISQMLFQGSGWLGWPWHSPAAL